jgi:hypothetical protein
MNGTIKPWRSEMALIGLTRASRSDPLFEMELTSAAMTA